MEQPTFMPAFDAMTKIDFTPKEWARYYRNTWARNSVAKTIDVENDKQMKAVNPDEIVQNSDGRMMPVKERLENRKIELQDALDIMRHAEALLALSDEELAAKWTPEALKVDEDMMPPKEVAGNACKTPDGKDGTWKDNGEGQLLCIPNEAIAAQEKKEEASPEATT